MEEKNNKDLVIKIKDDCSFCFSDKVGDGSSKPRSPQGYVEIYEQERDKEKQLVGKHNLVVNMGREWLLTRAFNTNNASITSDRAEFICWLGLGNDGAISGDPFNPIPPTNLDTDLASEVPISTEDVNCGDYHDGAYYKHPFDSLTFTQDIDNDNSYLILELVTTVGFDDANDYILNEAGLFTNLTNVGGASAPFHLYSRVTFPSSAKDSSRQLIFVWYIYF